LFWLGTAHRAITAHRGSTATTVAGETGCPTYSPTTSTGRVPGLLTRPVIVQPSMKP
jgi:hypothetical protein